jgi:hypothetical protein
MPYLHNSMAVVTQIVRDHYAKHGQGITRAELAEVIHWPQTRNLPGVRPAIDEGLICYDGTPESRLVPRDQP